MPDGVCCQAVIGLCHYTPPGAPNCCFYKGFHTHYGQFINAIKPAAPGIIYRHLRLYLNYSSPLNGRILCSLSPSWSGSAGTALPWIESGCRLTLPKDGWRFYYSLVIPQYAGCLSCSFTSFRAVKTAYRGQRSRWMSQYRAERRLRVVRDFLVRKIGNVQLLLHVFPTSTEPRRLIYQLTNRGKVLGGKYVAPYNHVSDPIWGENSVWRTSTQSKMVGSSKQRHQDPPRLQVKARRLSLLLPLIRALAVILLTRNTLCTQPKPSGAPILEPQFIRVSPSDSFQ